ncbi:MAG: glycosyl transferase [Actinomycetota bacterium]|nr:glycosyl transferase [Actinomycetota bacterium]
MRVAVVSGAAPGHAFPAAAVAQAAVGRGHDALLLTGRQWLPALARDGIPAIELPSAGFGPASASFGYQLYVHGARATPVLADVLREFDPDVVVVDTLTVSGSFAAGLIGRPWVELVPHRLYEPSRVLPPAGTPFRPGRTPVGRARDAALRRLAARGIALGAAEKSAARVSLGLPPTGPPAARLVATLPGFEHPRPDWPADAVLVGPLAWDPAEGDLPLPPGQDPLVFLSASTASGGATDLLGVALTGLTGVRLACTQLVEHLGPLPAWAVAGPGRQASVLAAARVVVAGAGHGLLAKSLAAGVPMVVVPGVGDQGANASRLVELHAGVAIPRRRLTPARLAAAVARVIGDPAYAEAAARVASTAAGLGPGRAVEAVEAVVAGQAAQWRP